jgi:hypothetical protein
MRACKAPITLSDYILQACIKTNTVLYYPQIHQCWEVRPLYTIDRSVVKFSEDRQLKKSIAYNRKKFCLAAKKIGNKPIVIMERYDEVFTLFPVDYLKSELEIVDVPQRNTTKVDTSVQSHELDVSKFTERFKQPTTTIEDFSEEDNKQPTTTIEDFSEEDNKQQEMSKLVKYVDKVSVENVDETSILDDVDALIKETVLETGPTVAVFEQIQNQLSKIQTELQLELEIPMSKSNTKSTSDKVTEKRKVGRPKKVDTTNVENNKPPVPYKKPKALSKKKQEKSTTYLAIPSRIDEPFIKDCKNKSFYEGTLNYVYSIRKYNKKQDKAFLDNEDFKHSFGSKAFNDKKLFISALWALESAIIKHENDTQWVCDEYFCVITKFKQPAYVLELTRPAKTYKVIDHITKDVVFDSSKKVEEKETKSVSAGKKDTGKSIESKPIFKETKNVDKVYAFPKNKGSSKFLDKCIATGRGFMVLRKDQSYYTVSLFADASDSITSKIPRINSTELAKTATFGKLLYNSSSSIFVVVRNGEYRYVIHKTIPVQTMQIIDCVTDKPVLHYGKPVMFPETLDISNNTETPMFRKVSNADNTGDISGNTESTVPTVVLPSSYLDALLKIEQALTRIANILDKS